MNRDDPFSAIADLLGQTNGATIGLLRALLQQPGIDAALLLRDFEAQLVAMRTDQSSNIYDPLIACCRSERRELAAEHGTAPL